MMQRWLLILTLVASLGFFGGWYTWTTGPIFLAALLVALANAPRSFHFPRSLWVLDLSLVSVALGIAFQLVPLPLSLVSILSPHATRVRGTLRLDAATLDDRWISLSVDPRATLDALLIFGAAVLLFWSARAAFAGGGLRSFSRALAVVGLVTSVGAIVQRATTPNLIYGFWPPYTAGAQPFGPFFNRNHFAGWLIMAIPVVAGYLAARLRTRTANVRERARVFHIFAVAGGPLVVALGIMLIALAATLSRSAIVGLAAAAVMAHLMARGRLDTRPGTTLPIVTTAVVAATFLLTTVDVESWFRRINSTLAETTTSRITIWRETLPLVRDFWLTGPGAGTYSMTMLLYQRSVVPMPHLQTFAHFNQAHSHYLQVAAEGGLLLVLPALVAAIAFARAARAALRHDRAEVLWIRVGATASLIAIATQSVWETALRMPANALLCAALAGIAVHRREGS